MRISGTSIKNSTSDSIDQPCILKRERSEGGELAMELRRRCKTGRSSPGILFRRSLRLRSRHRRHGQYNCDSNWIGKNAAAAEREGKKGLERRPTATTTHSMRKRRKEERGQQQHGSRSLLPSPKVWHGSQKSTSRRKKAIYLWQQQRAGTTKQNRTAAVFCWFIVGRSREEGRQGRRGARNQSSITICR